jgi:hypothetical protein
VKDEGKTRVFAKDKDKWKEGNKEMDSISMQALIDKLRDLAAAKFVDSGGGAMVFEAMVTSNEGKRNEKVLISKNADRYFAMRENEPAVYEIDTKVFDELKKAAADVKDPAPPKKDEGKDKKGK